MDLIHRAWDFVARKVNPAPPSRPPPTPRPRPQAHRAPTVPAVKHHACTPEKSWPNTSAPYTFKMPTVAVLLISPPGFDSRYNYVAEQLHSIGLAHERVHVNVSNHHRRIDVCQTNRAHTAVLVNRTFVHRSDNAVGMPERMISLLYNHVEVWNRVAMQKHITLVLEDDVNISQAFMYTLRQSLWQLHDQPWDILWPGHCCCGLTRRL